MKALSASRTTEGGQVTMRGAVVRAVLLVLIALRSGLAGQDAPAQRELRTYPLHGSAISADISPDEMFVATLLGRSEPTDEPSNIKIINSLQLWDFRQDKLIAEKVIQEQLRTKREVVNENAYVRYSGNGQFVTVYLDHYLYVLRQRDLQEIRRIPLKGPPDVTRSFTTKTGPHTVVDKSEVAALELSPVGQFRCSSVGTRILGCVDRFGSARFCKGSRLEHQRARRGLDETQNDYLVSRWATAGASRPQWVGMWASRQRARCVCRRARFRSYQTSADYRIACGRHRADPGRSSFGRGQRLRRSVSEP